MPLVKQFFGISQLTSWKEVQRFASSVLDNLVDVVNGQLSFVDNINADGPYTVTFSGSSDVQAVAHNLARVPTGVIEISRTAAVTTYTPSGIAYTWTNNKIFLQSSGAGSVTIYII